LGGVAGAFRGLTDASTRAFAAKIALKHDWTTTYALRVVAEYKKFVFLGATSDFPVTPPKDIDVVWRSCSDSLARPRAI